MVITDVNQVVYQGDGVTTAFPFTFRIIDATDVKLLLIDADGTETDITSDYFVDTNTNTVYYPGYAPGAEPGLADQPAPVQTGQRLVVYRELPVTQEKDLGEKWPFFVIESALDKLTMLIQQVKGTWDRCLKVSVGQEAMAPDFNYTVPIEAGKTFRVNNDGTGFELTEDPALAHAAAVAAQEAAERAQAMAEDARDDAEAAAALTELQAVWFDNVTAMKTADLPVGMTAGTKGYNVVNDGNGAIYTIRERKGTDIDNEDTVLLDNGLTAEKIKTITDTNLDSYQNKNDDIVDGIQKNVNGEVIKNKTAELTFPDIHSSPWMQDAVTYNDKLFVATGWGDFCVFNLNTHERIGDSYVWNSEIVPHCNPIVWGKKENDSDPYPLLYASVGSSEHIGACYVFGIDEDFTTYLKQTISIDFINKELWRGEPRGLNLGTDFNGFFFVDTENDYLYAISNIRTAYDKAVGRVFKFALPPTDNDVVLQEADIIETFDIPCYPITQGMHYENGLLYIVSGLHSSIADKYYLSVVDIDKKGQLVSYDLSDVTIESEGVWSYKGDIYINLYSLDSTPTIYKVGNIPYNQNIGNMAELQQKKRTLVEVANDTDNRVSTLESFSFSYPILDFEYVQNIVAQGKGEYVFPIGTKFYTVEKGVKLPWLVMHHGQHTGGRYFMYIRMMLANYIMQYTGVQAFYYAQNGLSAGTYYFSVPQTFENVPAGNYQFTLTKDVPAGGLLCLGDIPTVNCNRNPIGNKVYVFTNGKTTEPIEDAVISSGNSGTLLGSLQRAGDLSNNMNCIHRSVQASNNYAQSLPYQFINSDKFYGSVWESATIFDRYPHFTDTYSGFLNYVPKALLDIIQPAEMPNSTSSVFEVDYSLNSSYTTKKKFWLPSIKQVTGTDGGTTGETQFQYYVGKTNAQRIIYNANGDARPQWLRDELISYPNLTRSISNAGAAAQNASINEFAVCPCAEISLPE